MPSLKAVRLRIASVKSTQKITSAMKMVAAAKLRRSQDAIVAARPYAKTMASIAGELARATEAEAHRLLQQRPARRIAIVVMTSDRGLCGGFNTNLCRTAQRLAEDKTQAGEIDETRYEVVGRKGRDYFRRRKLNMTRDWPGADWGSALTRTKELASVVTEEFTAGVVDAVLLVYNEFRSVVVQKPVVEQLLPVVSPPAGKDGGGSEFLHEPGKGQILDHVLPLYVETQVHRALLESIASEFGARMTAMDNATKNATEMIDRLTLQYNRARQAAITKELMEIVGGAEALRG
ncbi:MAG: ATP synthase F1 subunit gamma [Deltaproteobacteria bacterium]|jgi:F-type H+-transporting ATPase subunit gamma|nr:ATP synthase F1 subunit gamma [Deltaproteobacteria bacterium]